MVGKLKNSGKQLDTVIEESQLEDWEQRDSDCDFKISGFASPNHELPRSVEKVPTGESSPKRCNFMLLRAETSSGLAMNRIKSPLQAIDFFFFFFWKKK